MKTIEKIKNPSNQLQKQLNKENIKIFQIEEISKNITINLKNEAKENQWEEVESKEVLENINAYLYELKHELIVSIVYYLNKDNIPIDEILTEFL